MSRYSVVGKRFTSFLTDNVGLPGQQAMKASLAFQSEAGQRELPVKSIKLGRMGKDGDFKSYSEKLESLKNVKVTPALELYKAMETISELPEGFSVRGLSISESAHDWLAKFETKSEEATK